MLIHGVSREDVLQHISYPTYSHSLITLTNCRCCAELSVSTSGLDATLLETRINYIHSLVILLGLEARN